MVRMKDLRRPEYAMADSRIAKLQRVAIFGGVREETLEQILEQSNDVHKRVNDCFFREGATADCLYQIESGEVSIQRAWRGEFLTLGELGSGDCFGEMALIDCQKRSATVRANTTCNAIEIPAKTLRALLSEDLEQYAIVMMNLGREVSRRLRLADDRLFALLAQGRADVD